MGEKESARRSTLMEKRYASLACNHRPYAFVYFLGQLLQYRVDFRISLVSHKYFHHYVCCLRKRCFSDLMVNTAIRAR